MSCPVEPDLPPAASPDYQRRILFLLGAVSNLTSAGASRMFRAAFDLGLGEGRLLYVVGYEQTLTAARASQIMGVDKGATSRALGVLERRRLVQVTADPGDARQRVIRLTAAGRRLRDRLMALSIDREQRLTAVFTAEEAETLSRLLQRLRGHLLGGAAKARSGQRRTASSTRTKDLPSKRIMRSSLIGR